MKKLTSTETKQNISFEVTPKPYGNKVYFNLNKRGGTALYNLETGEFENVRGEVGERVKDWIEKNYIAD
jgi:hypothetical protein